MPKIYLKCIWWSSRSDRIVMLQQKTTDVLWALHLILLCSSFQGWVVEGVVLISGWKSLPLPPIAFSADTYIEVTFSLVRPFERLRFPSQKCVRLCCNASAKLTSHFFDISFDIPLVYQFIRHVSTLNWIYLQYTSILPFNAPLLHHGIYF